jgi:RNA processing factor Prp31
LLGPSLSNFFQKGIGEQHIIGINQLVEICTSNIDYSNFIIGTQKENNSKDTDKDNTKKRSEYWKLLTRELKSYGDIKVAIKEHQDNHEKLQKEVTHLDKQKQEITNYIQTAISFINSLNNEISYYKGL